MTPEETIASDLAGRSGVIDGSARVQRQRRIIAEVGMQAFEEVFAHAIGALGFSILCTITGLDEGERIGLIYQMARTDGIVLSLKTSIPADRPVVKTVTRYFPPADIYERELADLLGVQVDGLGPGNRYPLPDNWPKGEYPLRKGWKQKAQSAVVINKEAKANA